MTTLDRELKFNICKLGDSYRFNKDIPNLRELISAHVPETFQYSSVFWSTHLLKSGLKYYDENAKGPVSALLTSTKALFWLEVLSLLAMVGEGIAVLEESTAFFEVIPSQL